MEEEVDRKYQDVGTEKVAGALLFSVFGFMGFFFSLWKHNWNSAAWCFFLELACVLLLAFYKPYLRKELHLRYSGMFFRTVKYAAVFLCVCSWCACASYIAVGVVKEEVFDVQSHYAASPVALMAGFWYLVLFCDARKYQILLE